MIVDAISHTILDQNFTNEALSKGISCPGSGGDPPSSSGRPNRTPESEGILAKANCIMDVAKQMFQEALDDYFVSDNFTGRSAQAYEMIIQAISMLRIA